MNNINWITFKKVLRIHEVQIDKFGGGSSGIRDLSLLESALNAPENKHYYEDQKDIIYLASVYLYRITKNHPFIDGNKRTATQVAIDFLKTNGFYFDINNENLLIDFVQKVSGNVENRLSEDDIYNFIKQYCIYFY